MKFYLSIGFVALIAIGLIFLLIKGLKLVRKFEKGISNNRLFTSRNVHFSTVRPLQKKFADIETTFRLILTDKELLLRPTIIDAYSERKRNLFHRIQLASITGIREELYLKRFKRLYIVYDDEGEEKEIVIVLRKVDKLMRLLDSHTNFKITAKNQLDNQ